VVHLALCELLQCPSIGEFTREHFVSGWRSLLSAGLNATGPAQAHDTISKQSAHIASLRRRLASEPAYFKEIYRSTFRLAKPENQKSVPMDAALEFWLMFFGGKAKGGMEWNSRRTPWLDWWLEFYETKTKRPVNKDLWNMVMELVSKTKEEGGESLEWWNENGAWPMAIDEFVEFVKERRRGCMGGQLDGMDTS
jgi:DCN1-like protein 1/2